MSNYKIGFIGLGNIASAIFGGIINSGYIKPDDICVFDTDISKIEAFTDRGAKSMPAKELTSECDFVFLTVKPQIYSIVLNDIKDCSSNTCFIDVAAGISISYVKELLGFNAPVIRAMPNTPLLCGKGSTALVKEEPVTEEQFAFVRGCFESCGITVIVDESKINVITAISGSAPAFVLRFASEIIKFGEEQGIDSEDCKKLVLQVFSGSSKLANDSNESIEQLIKNVTSPNGTTQAGLLELDANDFSSVVKNCLEATVNRARELSK